MHIEVDTREKNRAIARILDYFDEHGIPYYRWGLPTADYRNIDNPRILIDRKQNLNELAITVCQQHDRFVREIERCNGIGFHLIVLVEHGQGIKTLEDVKVWRNPRLRFSKMAVTGVRLYKILKTMSEKYHFDVVFCEKQDTAKMIIELTKEDGWKETEGYKSKE